ncbi:hypothetical protein DENIS_0408 [Desulfonema ishimotonii]|uniref:Uncharacterized protein n=1 Tax=Desulfonema ishimotonii TaxID=45657 RepID=A0A401FR79_9BACT|nr:hypothetical protein DENIS_0408 [Desulfonema ishimotonii]
MFSYISKNWRGRPLLTRETVVNLIAGTKTDKGLKIRAMPDLNTYEKGIKISDEEMKKINIEKDEFHGEWNYRILGVSHLLHKTSADFGWHKGIFSLIRTQYPENI